MNSDRKVAIRTRAHQLWEESGHVHGRDHQHWQQAEREYDEAKAQAGAVEQLTAGSAGPPPAKPARKPADKAFESGAEIPEAPVRKARAPRKTSATAALK